MKNLRTFVVMAVVMLTMVVGLAAFGAGVAFWAGEGGPILVGWSRRMAFGGAYEVAEDLWAQLHLGSSVVVAGPAGKGLLSGEYTVQQPVGVSGLTVTMGVRSGW